MRARIRHLLLPALVLACLAFGPAHPARAAWIPDGNPLVTLPTQESGPFVVSDGAAGAVVFWEDGRTAESGIYAQRIDSTGALKWSTNGVAVVDDARHNTFPTAIAYSGGPMLFWKSYLSNSYRVLAQRLDSQGISQWTFGGVEVADVAGLNSDLAVVSDGAGGISFIPAGVVAWVETPSTSVTCNVKIAKVNGNGTVAWGAGGGVTAATTTTKRYDPHVSMARDGFGPFDFPKATILVWSERLDSDNDIMAQRVTSAGVPQWGGTAGIPVCNVVGRQTFPMIANVASGEVIVVWQDERAAGNRDIYAQKLNQTGSVLWAAGGVPVCRASGDQNSAFIVSDGAGGAVIAWLDSRNGTPHGYAQRLNASGAPLWGVDGVSISTLSAQQRGPMIVTDGAGGIIATWAQSDGTTEYDIYAQHVGADGTLRWTDTGIPVCLAADIQDSPAIAVDNRFGALVAWQDRRSSGAGNFSDLYASRLYANPAIVDASPGAPATVVRFACTSANPSRAGAKFRLELPRAARVHVDLLDLAGRRVRELAASGSREAGVHAFTWDGADDAGARLPAGVFFARASVDGEQQVVRVVRMP